MTGLTTKVLIEVSTLDINSVPALLIELANSIKQENLHGRLEKSDGDKIRWITKIKQT